MWGVDLKGDTSKAVNKGYEHGLILVSAGENTLRFVPPLIVGAKEIDEFADKFGAVLSEMSNS